MSDSIFRSNCLSQPRFNAVIDRSWKKTTITDIQPSLDWLVDQHQLIDNPAPMTTVQTIRKILQSGKKVRHWDDTNIIDYLAPPPPGATYKLKTNCIAP